MNKKGFVGDIMTWVMLLGVLVLIIFFGFKFIESAGNSTDKTIISDSLEQSSLGWAKGWDIAIMAAFAFMVILSVISAWMIGTNPAFFFITLIVLFFYLLGVVVLNNLLNDIIDDATFLTVSSLMPGTMFLINNIFAVTIGLAFIIIIALFARKQVEQ